MKPNDRAFPVRREDGSPSSLGLSARDYTAIKAMQALLAAKAGIIDPREADDAAAVAEGAYAMADAMILESDESN